MGNVEKLLSYAASYIGYVEKASCSQLDDKLANAGNKNFTKFARDLDAVKFNNNSKQGYAWCTIFIQAMFYYAFGKTKALSMLYQPSSGNCGAGVDYMAKYFANNKATYSSPKVGDIVVFRNSTYNYAHVGIVSDVLTSTIETIEGNTSSASGVVSNGGAVVKKKYNIKSSNIVTYCRPNWSIVGGYDYNTKQTTKKFSITVPMISRGSNGDQVRALQVMLVSSGYELGTAGCDGDFGEYTESALKQFQERNGLTSDGIAGLNTYKKLWGIK